MKKTLKLALCGLMLAGAANAQVVTLPTDYVTNFEESWGTLPKSLSTDGNAKLISTDILEEGRNVKFNIYNSSFNIEHSFDIAPQVFQSKHVEERRAYVAIPGEIITIIGAETAGQGSWTQMSQEEKIEWLRGQGGNLLANYGYNIRYHRDSIYTDANGDVYMYLINSEYDYYLFREVELTVGTFILNKKTLKFQPFTYSRTGEWKVDESATRESKNFHYMTEIYNVVNMDNDWSYEITRPLLATQNIFNTDEKYEYLRYKYTTYSNRLIGEDDTDGDGITDVRSFESGYDDAGIEVVSEDGNVIVSFDAGNVEGATLILWEGKRYLGFYVYDEDYNSNFHIYEINPNGNSITRVSSEAFMHILPAMPRKNTSVTVEFGEESVKNGGQLMITDMNGRTVYRNSVTSGETTVRVPLRRMASGIYNVTLVNGGKKVENSKLIVR